MRWGRWRRVYLALGATDMRKASNSLSVLVHERLGFDIFRGDLFVFSNRRMNLIKVLYWDKNGFCLWQKRLEEQRFMWPQNVEEVLEIKPRQLEWLLAGLDIRHAHKRLHYEMLG